MSFSWVRGKPIPEETKSFEKQRRVTSSQRVRLWWRTKHSGTLLTIMKESFSWSINDDTRYGTDISFWQMQRGREYPTDGHPFLTRRQRRFETMVMLCCAGFSFNSVPQLSRAVVVDVTIRWAYHGNIYIYMLESVRWKNLLSVWFLSALVSIIMRLSLYFRLIN